MLRVLKNNKKKIKRSNKIIFKNSYYIKYPYENELFKLPRDREIALKAFLNNPYKKIKPKTMQDFFLKTFGKGILSSTLNPIIIKFGRWMFLNLIHKWLTEFLSHQWKI